MTPPVSAEPGPDRTGGRSLQDGAGPAVADGDHVAGLELGAAAVTFHYDDLVPDDATRDATLARFKQALDETGLGVEMATTNLFGAPVLVRDIKERLEQAHRDAERAEL